MKCKYCNHYSHHSCTNKDSDCHGQNVNADNGCIYGEIDWIRVEDKLPEISGMLVVVSDGAGYELAEYDGTDFFTLVRHFSDLRNITDDVKLWYPLPKLPKDRL